MRRRLSVRLSVYGIERSLNGFYKTLNGYHMSPTGGHAAFLVSATPAQLPIRLRDTNVLPPLCRQPRIDFKRNVHSYICPTMCYWLYVLLALFAIHTYISLLGH